MVRMADIIKKVEQRRQESEKMKPAVPPAPALVPPAPTAPTTPVPAPMPPAVNNVTPAPDIPAEGSVPAAHRPKHGLRLARMGAETGRGLNNDEAIHLYMKTLDLVRTIYDKVRKDVEIVSEDRDLTPLMEQLVEQQLLNNDNILGLISLPTERDYLCNHVVNVAIVAVEIAIGLGYTPEELVELAVAAILFDIGMVKFYDLYTQPRPLTKPELEEIKKHAEISFEVLRNFKHVTKRVVTVAYQQHERQDGSGYPCGLKGDSIDEYVKIIAVADVYDALTHPRPYRKEMQPYEALNHIIKMKDVLGARGVRAFIERICCPYPIGCYVRLSSGEKGMVVGRNIASAFRPIVEIIYNVNQEAAEMTRIIDLKKTPTVYVKDYLTKEEVEQLL